MYYDHFEHLSLKIYFVRSLQNDPNVLETQTINTAHQLNQLGNITIKSSHATLT
jgi:hypothetical protein